MTTLSGSIAWKHLAEHQRQTAAVTLRQRFEQQAQRAATLSVSAGPLTLNYSRQLVDTETLDLLFALALQSEVTTKLAAIMRGDLVNQSEQRSACHNLLRATKPTEPIAAMRAAMQELVEGVHSGLIRGATGQRFRQIVNIGIGGSDLGPRLVVDAMNALVPEKLECHFLANIDPSAIATIFRHCSPSETLFLVSSKSFSTEETLINAKAAMAWVRSAVGDGFEQHFVAISNQTEKATSLGITRCIEFPEWVGGRFSVWSAIALPLALTYGMDSYFELLRGGESIDAHTQQESRPAPVLSGLIDIWNRNFQSFNSLAVLPYSERLRLLPDYLQQLFMESQGKQTTETGELVDYATGMVLFGSQGSNGQHSFHQLLHQGSESTPCDLLLPLHNADAHCDQHERLIANCLGQSFALANGQSTSDIAEGLRESGMKESEADLLARHKTMPGNRPHSLISFEQVDAYTLGALIAYYEYRMMTACLIWEINPFDQWGVELGKLSSRNILQGLQDKDFNNLDPVASQILKPKR